MHEHAEWAAAIASLAATHCISIDIDIDNGTPKGKIRVRPKRDSPKQESSKTPAKPQQSQPQLRHPNVIAQEQHAEQLLRSIGVDAKTAQGYAALHTLDRIVTVVDAAKRKTSPSGWAVEALRKGWLQDKPAPREAYT